MRAPDEPIPPEERLFRWLTATDVNGPDVLPHAVQLERTSVNREKYWPEPARPAHQPGHPNRNGLAVVAAGRLPSDVSVNGVQYEFFPVDCPEDDNDAHAEARCGRTAGPAGSDRPDGYKPGSKAGKDQLRAALAEVLCVVRAPVG